jgi:hypothetical protein
MTHRRSDLLPSALSLELRCTPSAAFLRKRNVDKELPGCFVHFVLNKSWYRVVDKPWPPGQTDSAGLPPARAGLRG